MNRQFLLHIGRHIILWLTFTMAIGTGCSTFQSLNQGEDFFNQGDYASADLSFTQVIEAKSVNSYELQQAYLQRGETRLKLGDSQKALDDINAANDIFSSTKGVYLRGRANQKIGDFIVAISDFNQVIQIYSKESRQLRKSQTDIYSQYIPWAKADTADFAGKSSIALGEIYLYQENYPAAIAHFNSAALIVPTDSEVFLKRSGAYQLIEKKNLADKDFQHFLDLDGDPASKPEFIMGPLLLKNALAQYADKHYLVALDLANRAVELHPRYVGALMCRGHSYAKLRKHDSAVKDFSSVILEEPMNIEARIYRAFSFNELGKYDAAEQDTTYALANDPDNLHALFHRGFSHLGKKAYANAATDFSLILEIAPSHRRALIYRGIVRYQLKNMKGAKTDFQAVIDKSPNHKRAHYLLALTYYQEKKHNAALDVLIKAIELEPENSRLYHMRGIIYFEKGQKNAALEDFEKAVALNPENGKLYLSRGMAKSSLGRSAAKDYALAKTLLMQQQNRTTDAEEALEPKIEPLSDSG